MPENANARAPALTAAVALRMYKYISKLATAI